MNPVVDNFKKILDFAQSYGIPIIKKRAILREYLQLKILEKIYQKKISKEIIFVGGTSLRILRNIDRFSEDLDFDLGKIKINDIKELILKIRDDLKNENIDSEIYINRTKKRIYFEIRFLKLLYQLKISTHKEEKLMIKLDFESFWKNEKKEIILVNKYGFIFNTVTININELLSQKLFAYVRRKQTLARDLYDIVWLIGQEAKIDKQFLKSNNIEPKKILNEALVKFEREKKKIPLLKQKLEPYLFFKENANKINFFNQLLKQLQSIAYPTSTV